MYFELWQPGKSGQWIVISAASLCIFICGQAFAWPSAALPKMQAGLTSFSVNKEEESWMVTVMFLGNILSPIPAGYFMDKIGRKTSLQLFSSISVLSWVILYFSRSIAWLYLARVSMGFWLGFVQTLVPVLTGEVADASIRGSLGSIFALMMSMGAMYESLIGLYVSYEMLVLISLIPSLLVFLLFAFVPESPYFHLIKGNRHLAAKSLEWLKGTYDYSDLDLMEDSIREQLEKKSSYLDIVRLESNRKAFIMSQLLNVIQRTAGVTLLMSYSSIFLPDTFITAEESFSVLNCVWIVTNLLSSFIMDSYNRRTMLAISSLGCCLTNAVVATWFYLEEFTSFDSSTTLWLPLTTFIVNALFYSFGLFSIPGMVVGELFPVNIKGKAASLAVITASVTAATVTKIYHPLTDSFGLYSNFVICSISCAVAAIYSSTYMTETRGKTLEEIHRELTKNDSSEIRK